MFIFSYPKVRFCWKTILCYSLNQILPFFNILNSFIVNPFSLSFCTFFAISKRFQSVHVSMAWAILTVAHAFCKIGGFIESPFLELSLFYYLPIAEGRRGQASCPEPVPLSDSSREDVWLEHLTFAKGIQKEWRWVDAAVMAHGPCPRSLKSSM